MEVLTIVVGLLTLLTLVTTALRPFNIPQPTVMVIVGAAVGFVPGLPHVELPSDLVLLVFLPPLLYSHAWYINWRDFRKELAGITSLAVVLLIATALSVATVAHWVIPGMSWDVAFLLGAILCATDGIAASLIAHRIGLPRRLALLIEGEGLLNDAVAILLYKLMVSVVVAGAVAPVATLLQAALSAVGGVLIGLGVGWLAGIAHRFAADAKLETVVTILTPFVAYVSAEELHISGVLAVVTTGLYIGNRQAYIFSSATRLQAIAVWDVVTFILNGLIFLLVGLQMPQVMHGVARYSAGQLTIYACMVCLAVMLTRLLWLYAGVYLEKALRVQERLTAAAATVLGWAGMRGAISLAAVLALPALTDEGTPLPHRDLLAFLIAAVILCSLVLQSLTLAKVMEATGLCSVRPGIDGNTRVRKVIAKVVAARLFGTTGLPRNIVKEVAAEYFYNARRRPNLRPTADNIDGTPTTRDKIVQRAIDIEREVVLELRQKGELDDETMHVVLRDMDLRQARLGDHSH